MVRGSVWTVTRKGFKLSYTVISLGVEKRMANGNNPEVWQDQVTQKEIMPHQI